MPEGEVGDEMSVHYVQVKVVCSLVEKPAALSTKVGKIGVKDRWSDLGRQTF